MDDKNQNIVQVDDRQEQNNEIEILDESDINIPGISKKKFKLTNKHIIIGAIVFFVLIIGFNFLSGGKNIAPNAVTTQVEENDKTNELAQAEDGSKQEPNSKYKFVKEVEEKVVLEDTENILLTYYYSDIEKIKVDGKEVKYYILKKEVFLNNYRILKISDVFFSTENNINELINNDTYSNNNRIIRDSNNSGEYYLYYYGVQSRPDEGLQSTTKAMVVSKTSNVLFNFVVSNPNANGYALIEKYKLEERNGTFFKQGNIEEIQTEDTENPIEYRDHSLYSIYNNSLLDVNEYLIYYATINCREINEKIVTFYNGTASTKYVTTYYGDYFIKGDLCKSSE